MRDPQLKRALVLSVAALISLRLLPLTALASPNDLDCCATNYRLHFQLLSPIQYQSNVCRSTNCIWVSSLDLAHPLWKLISPQLMLFGATCGPFLLFSLQLLCEAVELLAWNFNWRLRSATSINRREAAQPETVPLLAKIFAFEGIY